MSITITKGKLTRWIIIAVILFCGAVEADNAPKAILKVVQNREFMADFTGYDNYSMIDVYQWRPGFYGVVMLCPAGILETFIYDTRNGKKEVIYRDAMIPRKIRREEMRHESIKVADAVRLAQSVAEHPNGNR